MKIRLHVKLMCILYASLVFVCKKMHEMAMVVKVYPDEYRIMQESGIVYGVDNPFDMTPIEYEEVMDNVCDCGRMYCSGENCGY